MPGPFIHISSMKHTATRLGNARRPFIPTRGPLGRINPEWGATNNQTMTDLGKLMLKWPNFASLGAIGPDLFFFLPDFRDKDIGNKNYIPISSILVTILNALEGLYAAVDPYISKYEKVPGTDQRGHRGRDEPPDRRPVRDGGQHQRRAQQHPHYFPGVVDHRTSGFFWLFFPRPRCWL